MSESMRAVVLGEQKTLSVCEIEKPVPGRGQLLLRVRACGICGSDLHAVDTGYAAVGTVLGHEFAGEVAAIGEGVGDHLSVGDRVNGVGALFCGECEKCQAHRYEECAGFRTIGFDPEVPGGYAEYMLVSAGAVFKVPDNVSDSDAAAVEPLAVGYSTYCDGKVEPGQSVLIIGAGPIGTAVAQWARYFGARHVGISDLNEQRLKRAGKAGADVLINAAEESDPVAAMQVKTGVTPAVIFECTGVPGMVSRLIEAAPLKAHLVLAGTGIEEEAITVLSAAMKKLRMSFCFGYEPELFPVVLGLLEEGRIDTQHIVTGTVGLDQVPEIFETLKKPNSHGKVIIEP